MGIEIPLLTLLVLTVIATVELLSRVFMCLIVAEDAFNRYSGHPVAWGVFVFFLPLPAIFIYYLTTHRRRFYTPGSVPPSEEMKRQKIRLKVVLWITGIFLVMASLFLLAALWLAFTISPTGAISI